MGDAFYLVRPRNTNGPKSARSVSPKAKNAAGLSAVALAKTAEIFQPRNGSWAVRVSRPH